MMESPFTSIGRAQGDIDRLRNELRGKVNAYEIHALTSKLDRLEHSLREISTALDGILSRLQDAESRLQERDRS